MWADLPAKIVMKCVCAEGQYGKPSGFADKFGWESIETDWRKVVTRDDIDLISICGTKFFTQGDCNRSS